MTEQARSVTLSVRNATFEDIPGILALDARVYKEMEGYSSGMIRGQITNYPDGQFVVEYDGEIVGYAASFRIDEATAMAPHSWSEITGGGYAARHDPMGDWLYGMDVCVDPNRRRLRIGQRLYDARRNLCESEGLKGIVFGGRMPNWARRRKTYSDPMLYVEAVRDKKAIDPTVNFHLKSGFEPADVLKNYLPEDKASAGYAIRMIWRNPYAQA